MKPFRSFVPPLAVMLLAASGGAMAEGVLIDKSEIRFVSKAMGASVEGRFRRWKANVDFRPKDLPRFQFPLPLNPLRTRLAPRRLRNPLQPMIQSAH